MSHPDFHVNTSFLTARDKPPTNLKGQIAERNKTRLNAFFVNCYLSHSPGSAWAVPR